MAIDINDLVLEAQAALTEIVQDFEDDLAEPTLTNAIALRWQTLPDEQKEMVKQRLPKTYSKIAQITSGRT